jgi:hypothetical protein
LDPGKKIRQGSACKKYSSEQRGCKTDTFGVLWQALTVLKPCIKIQRRSIQE